jgi:LPS-assembly protein
MIGPKSDMLGVSHSLSERRLSGNETPRLLVANAGYDFVQDTLQYGDVQVAYNWNCCGLSVEYRQLALGSVRRNDNECCSVTFTLAGVGSAGSQYFKRSERIF